MQENFVLINLNMVVSFINKIKQITKINRDLLKLNSES